MRLVSSMRSRHFTSNEYLYRAGTDAKWMFIITSGEVMERINWSFDTAGGDVFMRRLHLPQASSRNNPETVVNIELTLIGAGDIAGELPLVTSKRGAIFDIKAVTEVQALAIDRRYYENVMLTATRENKPEIYATVKKLRRFSRDREDWRQQRMECGISYPKAHVNITWHLMRMSNICCPRCGQRGHLATDLSKCDYVLPRQSQTVSKNEGADAKHAALNARKCLTARQSRRVHRMNQSSQPNTARPHSALRNLYDEKYLPSKKEQLEQCRDRML
ncbi:putative cyclic nucleotide-binding domain, rmlC-like jelly roll [Plasmopara halstedii]